MSEPLDLEPIKARLDRLLDRRVGTISDLMELVADADRLVAAAGGLLDYMSDLHMRLAEKDREILKMQQRANEDLVDHQREIVELREQLADRERDNEALHYALKEADER